MKSGKVACTKKVANCINCMVVKYLEMITIFENLLHHLLLPFPPEILLYAGPHAGHEVVEVHHHVDAHVEEAHEGGVAAPDPLDPGPGGERHDAVMDHVQCRQVGELLTAQEEEGVDEVDELGEEVPGHCDWDCDHHGNEEVFGVGVVVVGGGGG